MAAAAQLQVEYPGYSLASRNFLESQRQNRLSSSRLHRVMLAAGCHSSPRESSSRVAGSRTSSAEQDALWVYTKPRQFKLLIAIDNEVNGVQQKIEEMHGTMGGVSLFEAFWVLFKRPWKNLDFPSFYVV